MATNVNYRAPIIPYDTHSLGIKITYLAQTSDTKTNETIIVLERLMIIAITVVIHNFKKFEHKITINHRN